MFRCANSLGEAPIQMPPRNPPALTVCFLQLDSLGDNLRVVGSKTTWGPNSSLSLSSKQDRIRAPRSHHASLPCVGQPVCSGDDRSNLRVAFRAQAVQICEKDV